MSHERLSSKKEIIFKELSETEFELTSPIELYDLLRDLAIEGGINPQDALYVGLDTAYDDPLIHGFGDRTSTWAFNNTEYEEAAIADNKHGQHGVDSPIHYAATNSSQPTVLIFDGKWFDNALGQQRTASIDDDDYWDNDVCTDLEYKVKPGVTFSDTLVAALRIT